MALAKNHSERLIQLVSSAQASRQALSNAGRGLQSSMDVSTRLQGSMKRHMGLWSGSALVAGWVLSRLPARKKKIFLRDGQPVKDKGGKGVENAAQKSLWLALLGFAFQMARPALQNYVTEQAGVWSQKIRESQSGGKRPSGSRSR